jgi:serine phosphatase RsbU (regulator of sigma subunit)/pSer/pThr/pTyr-binding forkhead associated (FHA) protein
MAKITHNSDTANAEHRKASPAPKKDPRGGVMPSIQILKGGEEGKFIPLTGNCYVLGRNPDCTIAIPAMNSVSRYHARMTRVNDRFYIEDGRFDQNGVLVERSRNHTYVNNQEVISRTLLHHNDKIRICDFIVLFREDEGDEEPDSGDQTTVEAMLDHSSHVLLEQQPVEKLRNLIEISNNLSKTLELNQLLPTIVDNLFNLFRQADRCFLIQLEENSTKLQPRLVKTRRPQDETNARFSRSIVRKCLESAQAFLSDDASRDDRVPLSQSVVDFRIRSVMCVPLCAADGKASGVIQLDTQDRTKKFTQEDLKLLCCVANQAAVAMENAKLHADALARERLNRDLELAHQVQLSFLPRSLPVVPGYEFVGHYESALEVGGDYYGFIPLVDGRLAVALGDVAGKGVAAALLMAKLSSDTRFCLSTEPDPALAVNKLNDLLHEFTSPMDRFVTLALAVLDPAKHQVTLVNAGHLSPLLYRRGTSTLEEAVPKDATGLPLGVLRGCEYGSTQVALNAGDSLILFTDGVTDATDVRDSRFAMKGIEASLLQGGPATPKSLVERLVRAVHVHATNQSQQDDITLVALGRVQ